ncbi:MAG: dienelactone hydrolase family protein [Ardenticatenaceae bacterium]|nr:dienelactone hydrolase family protein [Anaerolineales bacterium]MCB8923640.1 dienelactone hydrolase family protein [Ardenticatenaceae bacterium]MCB8991859.1 dienelactone hydrolase family protein [Ardenticatenaceae bacterium]MCB9005146.1 dienelactone hydrolase family protein [Ardenticatenaceae bacterium]
MNKPLFVQADMTGLIHRVRIPDTVGPHPTVVMLHGRFGNEDVMWVFEKVLPPDWLLVAPRGLREDGDGYSWHPRLPDEWPCLYDFDAAVTAVTHFIHTLPKEYNADPRQIYLMGFSQGAAMAYALAMKYPKLVQGVAGLVGFVPEACDAAVQMQALDGLPVFMAVGTEDPLIPYEQSQRCAQTLQKTGADLTYRIYHTGHKLNAQGFQDLQKWWKIRASDGN